MGFKRVILGRTGFSVSPLGIASSYGTDAAMVEEAVDRGVNYLYWGAKRSPTMAEGIRRVARKNRDDLIIVVHTFTRKKASLQKIVEKSIKELGIDYIDVLLMAWFNKKPTVKLMEQANALREKGQIRTLALSGHKRSVFPALEKEKLFDIFHIRYNAAHRGAEKEIFDHFPEEKGPGVVSFTNTRWGGLLDAENMPQGEKPLTAVDCYRFTISHPKVHVAVCGPSNMNQLKENLAVLELGPMNQEEIDRMRRIGDHVYQKESQLKAQFRLFRSIFQRSTKDNEGGPGLPR